MAERLQWHPQLHRDWAKERLCFWRLGFYPTYDRDVVREQLANVFEKYDVQSFAPYELIGIHDLMLRIWLPTSITQGEFTDALADSLGPLGLVLLEPFSVDETISHWVWSEEPGTLRQVAPEVLEAGLPSTTIDQINRGLISAQERKRLMDDNVIAPSGHGQGIKFFIVITASGFPARFLSPEQSLRSSVIEHLANAPTVTEKSLYEGAGFGQFIVMGKVPFSKFRVIFDELIDPINLAGLRPNHQARTYTHICTTGIVEFTDRMPVAPVEEEDGRQAIEDYLSEDESATLEVKATAFTDIGRWLHEGRKPVFSDEILHNGVLKAITGMLNADGGVVVVGAAEAKRPPYGGPKAHEKLRDHPVFRDTYVLLGLDEFDLQTAGRGKDWDQFALRLGRTLRDAVEPSPVAWVTIDRATLMGRTLAVITVRPPDSGWYYLRDKRGSTFYVRQGNETRAMAAVEADTYKRTKGRI
jgi:hypothetical protein